VSGARWGAGFAAAARFVAEIEAAQAGTGKLRAGYVLAGDEIFLLDRCRATVLKALVPADLRDFCLSEFDLTSTSIFEVLDRAQTPSLMAPFQVIFVRNVRQLYTRGAKKDEFAALARYFKSPNPQALLLFVADFLRIPSDARRMELDDKNRYERLTETLGEHCGMVELARANEEDAMRWAVATAQQADTRLEPDAARELVDALGADMMLVSSELEKLLLYTLGRGKITLGDVETMVLSAKQRTLYERCHQRPRPRARAGPVAGIAEQLRRRRGRGDRASLHAGQNLPADAGDSGKERARFARHLAGVVAGISHAAVCRRRPDPPGATLQEPPRADASAAPGGPRRPGAALLAAR
jgi:hypothetical protein